MSSSSSNNIMLVGCIFCLISVQLFGLDGQDIGIDYFQVVCNVSGYKLIAGCKLYLLIFHIYIFFDDSQGHSFCP